jgi:membrane-associated protease RseP (regulator of RpoE activity)
MVIPGSAADDAGLMRGDIVVELDGTAITTPDELSAAIKAHKPGDAVRITVLRKGTAQTLSVELGEQKEYLYSHRMIIGKHAKPHKQFLAMPHMDSAKRLSFFMGQRFYLGVEYQELNPELGAYFGADDGKGILITEVVEDSPAAKSGLKAGDVILSISGKNVETAKDLLDALKAEEDDEAETTVLDIEILRQKQRMTVAVEVEKKGIGTHNFKWIQPDDEGGYAIHLKEMPEDFHLNLDLDIPEVIIPEVHLEHFDALEGFDEDILLFGDEGEGFHLFGPEGFSFKLKVDDDGEVWFNEKHFDSIDEFKDYLKSDEFKEYKKKLELEIQESIKPVIEKHKHSTAT